MTEPSATGSSEPGQGSRSEVTVAVDLGGTHVRAALVDDAGTVIGRVRRETPPDAPTPEVVVELIAEVTGGDEPGERPARAVIGLPGLVDHEAERLIHAPNLPPNWTEHLSRDWLSSRTGLEIALANDADLAAVGESSFGAGRTHRDVVYVTISTGVGAGLVVDDRLVRGALSGGELGHTVIDRTAAAAGQPATVEDLGSGTAIARRAAEAGLHQRGPALADLVRAGDLTATGIWTSAIEAVAIGLANLAWIVTPGIVVVGGGVGMNGDLVLPIVRAGLERFGPAEVPPIVVANAALVAVGVVIAQLLVGLALVTNRAVLPALAVGGLLNVAFLAVGAVNPSAFYLVGQGAVALWIVGRRPASTGLSIGLQLATAVTVALAVVSAPFITTIHPAEVIDDPAVMLLVLAGLTAVAAELTHRAVFRRGLP